MKRKIELLSPARDLETGLEALSHGADAVYIGAPAFSARAAAGVSVADIHTLCEAAHVFEARVYVALNTILFDDELAEAERLIRRLYDAGADALIVQDLSLLKLDLPPIALHASTQMDISSVAKARYLAEAAFSQIVLPREFSVAEIRKVHAAVDVPLEVFVHGALCVSYSGRCYASAYCFGRSANRGRCAQFCRLPFSLEDGHGATLVKDSHLLSLKDMNRADYIEELLDAGVSSLKIEGRLKDPGYVKNITAYYRSRLDDVLRRRAADYERASYGTSVVSFEPRPAASFNRGFTDYFLHGRGDLSSMESPKSRGEYLGRVTACDARGIRIATAQHLAPGDGLCYVSGAHRLEGVRVNSVAAGRAVPARPVHIPVGTPIYRNHDAAFARRLAKPTASRRLSLDFTLRQTADGVALTAQDEAGRRVELLFPFRLQPARTPQRANIVSQLSKLGETPFVVRNVNIELEGEPFIPSSRLTAWRREATDALLRLAAASYVRPARLQPAAEPKLWTDTFDYTANIANLPARAYYLEHGARHVAPAFELEAPREAVLMTCRYCLRHALGHCLRREKPGAAWAEPLALRLSDGRRFPLRFDCTRCEMQVLTPRTDAPKPHP